MRILLGGIDPHDRGVRGAFPAETSYFQAETAGELLESVCACAPDLLLIDSRLPELLPALRQIGAVLPVPVVVIADAGTGVLAIQETDIFAMVPRPLSAAALRPALAVACVQFQRLQAAREEAAQLRDAFAARKIIEQAKGLLMQRRAWSEADAYRHLREESRRQRTPIVEIARGLLSPAPVNRSNI